MKMITLSTILISAMLLGGCVTLETSTNGGGNGGTHYDHAGSGILEQMANDSQGA